MKRRGFALYLAFVVTTVLFFLAIGSFDIAKSSMDLSRSGMLDTVGFHAADGGLEIGLARLRNKFEPFTFAYHSDLGHGREVEVTVNARPANPGMNLSSEVLVLEGRKIVAKRRLSRYGVGNRPGRNECGQFVEES